MYRDKIGRFTQKPDELGRFAKLPEPVETLMQEPWDESAPLSIEPEPLEEIPKEMMERIRNAPARAFVQGLVMGILLGIVSCLFAERAFGLPKVYKLDLSYARLVHNSDPMMIDVPSRDWGDAVNIDIGVEADRFFLDANPHFESAYHKVTSVGLYFRSGFRITNWLDVEWTHHSRHSADRPNTYADTPNGQAAQYPLYDSVGLRVHFIPDARRKQQ